MSRTLSQREKILSYIVGGAVLFLVNLFVLNYFFTNRARIQEESLRKGAELRSMQSLLAASPLWEQRDTWLRSKQPALENEARAGSQLLDQIQDAARKEAVSVEQPVISAVERRPYCTSVSVNVETKSTWKSLVNFLAALQGPEQFIVLETANFTVDTADATQMRGHFRVSKWYAPK